VNVRTVFEEAVQSVRASMSTTLAATTTVLIGMFILGLAIGLGTWLLSWSHNLDHQITTKVYFLQEATPTQETAVARRVQHDPRVKHVVFVSKEQALKEMKKKSPDLFKGGVLPYNPLPDALTIVPKHGKDAAGIRQSLQHPLPAGVEKVKDGGATSRRILRVGKIIWIVFLAMVLVLLAASTLLIANTLRLAIFARRREIEVMKLVGASNWFVRGPFMIEGLLTGLAGSVLAVVLLLIGKTVITPSLHWGATHTSDAQALAFPLNALILVGMGLLLGAAASGVTLRRFLRV
jgi:cell division transport system permease protein